MLAGGGQRQVLAGGSCGIATRRAAFFRRGGRSPPWSPPTGKISHPVVAFSDISQRNLEAEEQVRNLAFFDPLTQLPNRRLLIDRLGLALATTARYRKHEALLFLDIDCFQSLNDPSAVKPATRCSSRWAGA